MTHLNAFKILAVLFACLWLACSGSKSHQVELPDGSSDGSGLGDGGDAGQDADSDSDTDTDTDGDGDSDTDGDGDADGSPDGGGDAGQDGGGQQCDLDPITKDTTVNINVNLVTISGVVSMNGSTMPNDTVIDGDDRGHLAFVDKVSGASGVLAYFGEAGPANYSTQIFAGTYDVYLVAGSDAAQSVLPPSASTLLVQNLEIKGDLTRNFDVTVVTVNGEVTLNSATMPDNSYYPGYSRGVVRFVDTTNPAQTVESDIGATGKALYSAKLFGGTYNVLLVPDSYYQNMMPDATARLAANDSITANQTKNYNVKVVTASGEVTLGGATMTDGSYTRGYIQFRDSVLGTYVESALGVTGNALYSVDLFTGTYDVMIMGQGYVLPEGTTRVAKDVTLTADASHTYDVGIATVMGDVTVNGLTMPDNGVGSYDRGQITFMDTTSNVQAGGYYDGYLGYTGAASYSQLVFKSTYDVYLQGSSSAYQDVLPSNGRTKLQAGWSVTADTTKNFNAKVYDASGKVTVNSAVVKDDTILDGQERGWVDFVDTTSSNTTTFPLGETGAALYDGKLFGGTYNVFLRSNSSYYQDALPASVTTSLQENLAVSKDTAKDFNKNTALVSGIVTLNNAVMPNDSIADDEDRGWLSFIEKTGSAAASFKAYLGESGPANFAAEVYTGIYDIFLTTNDELLQDALPPNTSTRVKTGCTK